jgi:adenylyltransferase/sulfurtransferase
MNPDSVDRYSRQVIFIGEEGQRKLSHSFAVIIGCGALGTVIATALVRAGVGKVRIVDRDFIEYHNLQRQVLFDEDDIKNQVPKAIAAERHLKKVNSSIEIEGVVADVNPTNIEKFVKDADVILDGLDNFETRLLINDVSLKHDIPWVYGGAISSYGMTMTIIPRETPCLRCFVPGATGRRIIQTCDTAGVINPIPFIIGSIQTAEAMKIMTGAGNINRQLITIDVWRSTFDHLKISPRPDCPACQGKYEYLEGKFRGKTTVLCGQNAVQVSNPKIEQLSLTDLAAHLKPVGEVSYNEFMLRLLADGHELVFFTDGRAIIKNTTDETLARGLYAKYIGT